MNDPGPIDTPKCADIKVYEGIKWCSNIKNAAGPFKDCLAV